VAGASREELPSKPVYCFAKITQKELKGEEEGRLSYLWLIIMMFLFMLYGLYTWGVYPFKK
jgi:hypothetical protein